MKVLFVHTYYKQSGGEDQVLKNETTLLTPSVDVLNLNYYNTGSSITTALKFFLAFNNIFSARRLDKVIRKEKPDVIHLHNWHFAASPSIIRKAKQKGIPIVYTLHNFRLLCPSGSLYHKGNLFLESLKKGFPWEAVKRGVYRESKFQSFWLAFTVTIHKHLGTWRSVDKFITLTEHGNSLFANSNLNIAPGKIVVKPNFVADNGFAICHRKLHFLFVGRLTEEKGVELLLEAFSKTEKELLIIGDGPLKEVVENHATRFRNISYLGKQGREIIIKEMKQASALVFPSKWFEGMPMTILEAFSTGTPVIASRLGAMESMIINGHNGLHFKAGDENDLIKKLSYWNNLNEKDKREYGKNSRNNYEQLYTPQKNLEQLLQVYNAVIPQAMQTTY